MMYGGEVAKLGGWGYWLQLNWFLHLFEAHLPPHTPWQEAGGRVSAYSAQGIMPALT